MSEEVFEKNGYGYITAQIEKGLKNGSRRAVIRGCWEIDRAVRIPSDFTLELCGCRLRLADGCFSNIFVNASFDTEAGRTKEGADRNISIIGAGGATLDGGSYNGLSEKTEMKNGFPPVWNNNLLLFVNVRGFRISGLFCRNMRWWGLNFICCSDGYVGNIDFCANDTGIGSDGAEYHGLRRDAYDEVLVKNADGIDLRRGCHDIVIENITGFTEDDTVALTALNGTLEKTFDVPGACGDIYNVTVRNVRAAAFCSIVRILNQGELKIHDITVDGVYDTSAGSPHMDRGIYALRIGDTHLYGTRRATGDETYNITVRNVRGRGYYAVSLVGEIKNLVTENIEAFDGAGLIKEKRE